MTDEEKYILAMDLSSRLPYAPKLQVYYEEMSSSGTYNEDLWSVELDSDSYLINGRWIEYIKPYLRPISSMTDDEYEEYCDLNTIRVHKEAENKEIITGADIEWLNERHFDYRKLIERNLAISAPEGMYEN